ncbi:MAG: LemA family protein [Nitriliruptor sp.]
MEPWVLVGLVLGLPALWLIVSYNRFVAQLTSLEASWAGIDVELQRRHDLVPRLVETAAGYAGHERRTFEAVTAARARAVAARDVDQQARAEDQLTEGLTGLLALGEAYPDLRADGVFRDLQRQLIETEDRIAASRRLYNLEVAAYERRRGSVPSNIVAGAFSFGPRASFEVLDAAARHAQQVRL